ncbi:hypothetical protein K9L04_01585 [Patescibacteria group bacterium]|nr:hypothetical protein [Patescibacteria group bacterium]
MRKVLSISLPSETLEDIKKKSKKRNFDSISSYIKYLFSLDNDLISEDELLDTIKSSREEYKKGESISANSLSELL